MQSISVFLDIQNLLISGDKMLMSAELKGMSRNRYTFGSSLGKV